MVESQPTWPVARPPNRPVAWLGRKLRPYNALLIMSMFRYTRLLAIPGTAVMTAQSAITRALFGPDAYAPRLAGVDGSQDLWLNRLDAQTLSLSDGISGAS